MLQGEALEVGEAVALGAGRLEVVILERTGIGQQLLVGLAVVKGRLTEFSDPAAWSACCTSGSARKARARSRNVR